MGQLQAGSGMARSRAKARLNWVSQGQRWGRCRVRRRAERVMRPARAKNRRRRVLVVTICSPRPMRAVQRARLWAITCTASQAPLAAKRPEGRWFSPTPYLRSRIAFSGTSEQLGASVDGQSGSVLWRCSGIFVTFQVVVEAFRPCLLWPRSGFSEPSRLPAVFGRTAPLSCRQTALCRHQVGQPQ